MTCAGTFSASGRPSGKMLETQAVLDESRKQIMLYLDCFIQWTEVKRVEEYAMLHSAWSLGRVDRQKAVMTRVQKVLAA